MTREEINIAIAEACGWKPHADGRGYYQGEFSIWKSSKPLSDYTADLNAIQAAVLTMPQDWQDRFTMELTRHCGSHKLAVNASARQRAEAFLRTLGKWKE